MKLLSIAVLAVSLSTLSSAKAESVNSSNAPTTVSSTANSPTREQKDAGRAAFLKLAQATCGAASDKVECLNQVSAQLLVQADRAFAKDEASLNTASESDAVEAFMQCSSELALAKSRAVSSDLPGAIASVSASAAALIDLITPPCARQIEK